MCGFRSCSDVHVYLCCTVLYQVGVHELLGHGSGKLFQPNDQEMLSTLPNPLTGEVGTINYYPTGATWDTTFGKIASGYEVRVYCFVYYVVCGIHCYIVEWTSSIVSSIGH